MPCRAIVLALALLSARSASAEWQVLDADPMATASVETRGPADTRARLAINCLRGTSIDTFSLDVSLPIPRIATALPQGITRQDLRLGRSCPGPIEPPTPPGSLVPLRLRVAGEVIETRARVAERFRRREPAIGTRQDGPCEVATFAIDPDLAELWIEGGGETRSRYLVELLRGEHAGDVEVTLPEHRVSRLFPIEGAASALSRLRRLCGWED